MSGRIMNCQFKTGTNEQIDAKVRLRKDPRSCIFGTVVDECGRPVADAVVKLLQIKEDACYPIPLTHTFTDDNGQFLMGPLCPDTTYMLKIYKDNVKVVNKCLSGECYDGTCISADEGGECGCPCMG